MFLDEDIFMTEEPDFTPEVEPAVAATIFGEGIEIVDPGMGKRVVSAARFSESFTGVALVFEPSDTFEPKRRGNGRFGLWGEVLFFSHGLILI